MNTTTNNTITIGRVVDVNDPLQNGRLRVLCPALFDTEESLLVDIPWASYASPIAGIMFTEEFGRGSAPDDGTGGPVNYGFWSIPKVGAQVLVACIDGDPNVRVWLGCVPVENLSNVAPHGRFSYDTNEENVANVTVDALRGPNSSDDSVSIAPLYDNFIRAFGQVENSKGEIDGAQWAFEWRTRVADYTNAQSTELYANVVGEHTRFDDYDVRVIEPDGSASYHDQGYAIDRLRHAGKMNTNMRDSQTHSWTTPGFHAISMDDREENCRIRVRSTTGHQIILDDTNERIYVATAKGNNWIEMDVDGNIDIFTTGNISMRSGGDINMTADKNVRIYGKEGVHIRSDEDIHSTATNSHHIKTEKGSVVVNSKDGIDLSTAGDIQQDANNIKSFAKATLNLSAKTATRVSSAGNLHLKSDSNVRIGGAAIHLNSVTGMPEKADVPKVREVVAAFFTSRIPDHEPWARTMTKDDYTTESEFEYMDQKVGRFERGREILRGIFWKR